ncbi:hypothetical protein NE237_022297 [Protea cynaroides]|uniref:Uncharacterized protein n=1 Tax=Protea cynaroides TaxID=273540 RepID=A0A9Q0K5P3_9MAGN|nr:hypothetical protein NE237_022297 [Protea cynaroides]
MPIHFFTKKELNVEKLRLTTDAFFKMPNLRLLHIDCPSIYRLSGGIEWEHCLEDPILIFKNLVWLHWKGFPLKYIPNNFHLGNLVILDMQESPNLNEVWKGTKYLLKLKVLNLSYCEWLVRTPNLSGLPNLEKLILNNCYYLFEVDASIGHLSKLVELDLSYCRSLRYLSSGISKLVSLEKLYISDCGFQKLPEEIGKLTHLTELCAHGTGFGEVPSSLGFLKNLTIFKYSPFPGKITTPESAAILSASLYGLCSLKYLDLGHCNLTDDDLPDDIWKSCSLKFLRLFYNNYLTRTPSSICGQFSELETLSLVGCKSLQSVSMLPSSLRSLDASNCQSLERLPNLSNLKHLKKLSLSLCQKLNEIEGLEGLESVEIIKLDGCYNLRSFAEDTMFQVISKDFRNRNICDIYFPRIKIWERCDIQKKILSASCEVARMLPNMEFQGVAICIVCVPYKIFHSVPAMVIVHNQSKNYTWNHEAEQVFDYREDLIWMIKISHCVWKSIAEHGDIINVSVKIEHSCTQVEIGVHLFFALQGKVSHYWDSGPLELDLWHYGQPWQSTPFTITA